MKFKNVLLIDDDEDCLFLTKHSLDKLKIFECVEIVTNGPAALKFITDNCGAHRSDKCPNIIFVDNQMGGMDGFAFLERLSHIPGIQEEDMHVYMVSSFTNDQDKEKLKKYNIKGFINKPLSLDKLKVLFN